jgi:hypothetical protein
MFSLRWPNVCVSYLSVSVVLLRLKHGYNGRKQEQEVRTIGQPRDLTSSFSKMTDGGLARLYSKVLVEENRRHRQRQDRVPKALN